MKYLLVILLPLLACSGVYSQDAKAVYQDTAFVGAVLRQHNVYRAELQLPPLEWSPALASDALVWGRRLAKGDQGQHDPGVRGLGEGENLFWGTAGAFPYEQMVGFWGNEKKDFVYGTFPNCKTKRSAVVGHYTQIVWKNTRSVGCALVSNGKTDFLVCRYSPPGNVEGEKPY